MKKLFLFAILVLMAVQGCNNHSLREDIKDVGQDIKNEVNKATD